jgi:hypothetical protein
MMHNYVARQLANFRNNWVKEFDTFQERRRTELDEFEERQRTKLEAFNQELQKASLEFKPPGAPRKRAWIFG